MLHRIGPWDGTVAGQSNVTRAPGAVTVGPCGRGTFLQQLDSAANATTITGQGWSREVRLASVIVHHPPASPTSIVLGPTR